MKGLSDEEREKIEGESSPLSKKIIKVDKEFKGEYYSFPIEILSWSLVLLGLSVILALINSAVQSEWVMETVVFINIFEKMNGWAELTFFFNILWMGALLAAIGYAVEIFITRTCFRTKTRKELSEELQELMRERSERLTNLANRFTGFKETDPMLLKF